MHYTSRTMNRRQFILYAAAATGVVVAGTWRARIDPGSASVVDADDGAGYAARVEHLRTVLDDPDLAVLLALVPSIDSAAALGAHLRANDATSRDERVVVRNLRAKLLGDDLDVDTDVDGVRRRLRDQIDRDFATDRTVTVDGWLLAETSTELHVLASLVHDRTGIADDAL
jgi:hypothetical protein